MGVQINGDTGNISATKADYSGNVTIGGTLTYEDVTNIDSVGLVTARSGLEIGAKPGVAASISVDGNMIVSGISTFGGDVQVPDKIIHSGDTDTAIRFPSADTITAETGGTERLRITSDGKYQFPGTGGGSGARGLEIDTESIGAADEGVILNARASGNTGQIKLQTNSATAVTVEGNGGNVNVASNLKVAGVCTATSFSGSGANLTNLPGVTIGSLTSFGTSATKDITIDSSGIYKIEFLFKDVSCSGGTDWQFQLGDSGGVETSGYLVSAGYYSNASYAGNSFRTDGFRWRGVSDGNYIMQGIMTFTNYDGNRWIGQGHLGTQTSSDGSQYHMLGSKELSGALTTIRLMAASDSSETFDGGYYKIITHSS